MADGREHVGGAVTDVMRAERYGAVAEAVYRTITVHREGCVGTQVVKVNPEADHDKERAYGPLVLDHSLCKRPPSPGYCPLPPGDSAPEFRCYARGGVFCKHTRSNARSLNCSFKTTKSLHQQRSTGSPSRSKLPLLLLPRRRRSFRIHLPLQLSPVPVRALGRSLPRRRRFLRFPFRCSRLPVLSATTSREWSL